MRVLLVSSEDPASINIKNRLLEEAEWEMVGKFRDRDIHQYNDLLIIEKEGTHLYFENVDSEIADFLKQGIPELYDPITEYPLDLLVFLSRHRSEMDIRSLTVHPPGNFLQADYGGMPGKLPPSAPIEMTAALRSLYKEKKAIGLKDQTTYEVTHHGPSLDSPSFFIEIGSNEGRWEIPELGKAIAKALLSDTFSKPSASLPIAIGIGGGHYAARFTDRAMRKKFAFGHMIPDYILLKTNDVGKTIELAIRSTPGAEIAFFHRSLKNEERIAEAEVMVEELGLRIAN